MHPCRRIAQILDKKELRTTIESMPTPPKIDEILDAVCAATTSRSERLRNSWTALEPFLISAVQEYVKLTATEAATIANIIGIPLPGAAAEKAAMSAAALLRGAGRAYVTEAQRLAASTTTLRNRFGSTQS